jgi:hypothetical protein
MKYNIIMLRTTAAARKQAVKEQTNHAAGLHKMESPVIDVISSPRHARQHQTSYLYTSIYILYC